MDREVNLFQLPRDNFVSFIKLTMLGGSCVIVISSVWNTDKECISPRSSGNLSIFEQPEMLRFWRNFNLQMPLGTLRSLFQSCTFIWTSLWRHPTDWSMYFSPEQSSRISFSRLGSFEKSGVLIRRREWLRLRIFKFPEDYNIREEWIFKHLVDGINEFGAKERAHYLCALPSWSKFVVLHIYSNQVFHVESIWKEVQREFMPTQSLQLLRKKSIVAMNIYLVLAEAILAHLP